MAEVGRLHSEERYDEEVEPRRRAKLLAERVLLLTDILYADVADCFELDAKSAFGVRAGYTVVWYELEEEEGPEVQLGVIHISLNLGSRPPDFKPSNN